MFWVRLTFLSVCLGGALFFFILLGQTNRGMFLEGQSGSLSLPGESEIPEEIPLLEINTETHEDPPYEQAERWGQEQGGETVTGNDYVSGNLYVYANGAKQLQEKVWIRVRGNSSSLFSPNQSYHLKLKKRFPLMGEANGSYKDWVLLSNGRNLKTYVGDVVGAVCGLSLQPKMIYVNVSINGDWKGCYCLTTPVNKDTADDEVSKSGLILEDTVYWWNEETYFQTKGQSLLGFAFKYPEIDNEEDDRYEQIKNYMQDAEDAVFLEKGDRYQTYIDEETFAKWILAQDLLGNSDGLGSNIYYFKDDFIENNPFSSKLKMCLVWDMDGIFMTEGEWSGSRIEYFPYLFQHKSFQRYYEDEWNKVEPELYQTIEKELADLEKQEGEAIDQSWELEEKRWNGAPNTQKWAEKGACWDLEIEPFSDQKESVLKWFEQRIRWMNEKISSGSYIEVDTQQLFR